MMFQSQFFELEIICSRNKIDKKIQIFGQKFSLSFLFQ